MNKLVFRYFLLAALVLLAVVPALAQDSDAFPLTIEHKFGTITLAKAPQRVVSIGYNTQDALFALGVQPIAVRYWFGDQAAHGVFPWAEDGANDAQPVLLDMPEGVNFEAILALQPDLIVAVYSGISREEYELLSQIAPTLVQPDGYGDFTIPWQVATQFIGDALGKSEEAAALIRDVEAQFAAVREQHPEFVGRTFVIANYYDGSYGYFTGEDPRSRFFTDLGFVVPDELVEIAGNDFYANISMERIDLLDQDLLVFQSVEEWAGGREGIESDPVLGQMRAMQEGRAVFIPPALDDAFQFQTVLSLPYFLEGIVPELARAVNGGAASAQCEPGFWLFEHERLATDPVCIPEDPQRIVSLDMPATEFLLLNDIPIVGVFEYAANEISAITPGLADELEGIPTFGWPPNLELVTELEPDLIIAFKDSSLFYEGMEAIAPLVVYDAAYATDWKSSTSFWSQVFQREDAYEAMLATYEARVAELQVALGEDRGEIEVSAFVPSADYPMIWLVDSAQGVILQDVGLGRPESQRVTFAEGGYVDGGADYGFVAISNERLDLADGDEIFIFTWPTTDAEVMAENLQYLEDFHENNPLWQSLDGVRAGNVHIVGAHWFRAQTYLAANLILDDLFTHLTDVEPTIPNPVEALAGTE